MVSMLVYAMSTKPNMHIAMSRRPVKSEPGTARLCMRGFGHVSIVSSQICALPQIVDIRDRYIQAVCMRSSPQALRTCPLDPESAKKLGVIVLACSRNPLKQLLDTLDYQKMDTAHALKCAVSETTQLGEKSYDHLHQPRLSEHTT